MLMLNR